MPKFFFWAYVFSVGKKVVKFNKRVFINQMAIVKERPHLGFEYCKIDPFGSKKLPSFFYRQLELIHSLWFWGTFHLMWRNRFSGSYAMPNL